MTSNSTAKLGEVTLDPHVNLSYYKDGTRRISVSGLARLARDPARIARSTPDWKMWFPDEGDPRHGTPDDPRIVLVGVECMPRSSSRSTSRGRSFSSSW